MTQRNLLSESNQMQGVIIHRTFAMSSEICRQQVSGLSLEKRKQSRDMFKRQIYKDRYCSDMAKMARQQLALMNKCRMQKRGGKGVASQPFYETILNR